MLHGQDDRCSKSGCTRIEVWRVVLHGQDDGCAWPGCLQGVACMTRLSDLDGDGAKAGYPTFLVGTPYAPSMDAAWSLREGEIFPNLTSHVHGPDG
jgi:hypothetical protein